MHITYCTFQVTHTGVCTVYPLDAEEFEWFKNSARQAKSIDENVKKIDYMYV